MSGDLSELRERLEFVEGKVVSVGERCDAYLKDNLKLTRWVSFADSTRTLEAEILADVPTSIKSEAGMIANELRACLDALACRLAERNGKTAGGVYFPISKSEEIFRSDGLTKIKKLRTEDRDSIANLSPWKGGNRMLWALHEADRTRKHQRLIAHAASFGGTVIGGWLPVGTGTFMQNCVVNGSEFDLETFDGDLSVGKSIKIARYRGVQTVEPHISVAYAEPVEIKGRPLTATLSQFTELVRSIVDQF